MAVGQAALRGASFDVAALDAVETRLEVLGDARSRAHAQLLREVLVLHRMHVGLGCALSTVPQVALLVQVSQHRAHGLLAEALLLHGLPEGLDAVECGLLTVEQTAVLSRVLGGLEVAVQLRVWQRLRVRLLAAVDDGSVLSAAELARLLSRWVIAADPVGAQTRRRAAEAGGEVSYRRRDDGLGDLFATAIPAPLLQAVLCRLREASRPWGSQDERTAGKRRLDALINLILGRDSLPFGGDLTSPDGPDGAGGGPDGVLGRRVAAPDRERAAGDRSRRPCTSRCGCRLDAPVPCGVDVVVHVPLGAALGLTDEVGELVGHGPLDPQQLAQILLAGPRLRAVHVDAHGVPVSVADQVHVPPRDDPEALRAALLSLASSPRGPAQPQHPHDHPATDHRAADHPPTGRKPDGPRSTDRGPARGSAAPLAWTAPDAPPTPSGESPPGALGPPPPTAARESSDVLATSGHPHPPGTPGSYRPPPWLRRLVEFRAPHCEWPGCGVRAQFCDFEHDRAWPTGPTCACNTGPLCRHHHRIKQQPLWTKTRGRSSAVTWTDLTGRHWTRPAQHDTPAPILRALPALTSAERLDRSEHMLSPQELAELLADPDLDPIQHELRSPDSDPDAPDHDRLADHLDSDTRWTLDLDDPYLWTA